MYYEENVILIQRKVHLSRVMELAQHLGDSKKCFWEC